MDVKPTAGLLPPLTRSLISVALTGFVLVLLHLVTPILTPILFAFFLGAMAMSPFNWLMARGMRRGPALILMLGFLIIGGGALVLLILISVRSLQAGLTMYSEQLVMRMNSLKTTLSQIGPGAGERCEESRAIEVE